MKKIVIVGVLLLGVLLLAIVCCMFGGINYSLTDLREMVFQPEKVPENLRFIFLRLRLPRVIVAAMVGASLGVCGTVYQSVFRNPLSDPYVLGVSSGASLGAAIAFVIGLKYSFVGVGVFAFAGAMLTVLLILRLASIGSKLHTATLLLSGIALNFMISAVISFILILHHDKMEDIMMWTMGSLSSASWGSVWLLTPVTLIGIGFLYAYSKELNILLMGDKAAQSLGVDVQKTNRILLIASSLIVAIAVSTSGVIGFVGLVIPHIVRLFMGADNKRIIPFAALLGGCFMMAADTFARTVVQPSELPVGSITALIGSPFFLYLLYRAKNKPL